MNKLNEALKQEIDKEILPTGVSKTKDGYRVSYKFNGKHLSFGERRRLNDAIALNDNVKVILELARGNNVELLEENRQLKGKVTELKKEVESLELWSMKCRSEEHTSELQSRFDLVCRLLLENKKT